MTLANSVRHLNQARLVLPPSASLAPAVFMKTSSQEANIVHRSEISATGKVRKKRQMLIWGLLQCDASKMMSCLETNTKNPKKLQLNDHKNTIVHVEIDYNDCFILKRHLF